MSNPYHKPAGHPIPPKTNLMLSTTLLGPYDNLPTSEKTIVSAAIPPDVKERLFVDFLPRRGAVDKLMTRQLYMIDAYLCANPSILSIEENKREEVVNNLLNALNDFLSELKPANIATNNMKKILIGTATYRKRAAMPNTDCIGAENTYIPAVYKPPYYEWTQNDNLPHQSGILHGFFTESDTDGASVVGLVEHPDGTFDTYASICLKFETPTALPA